MWLYFLAGSDTWHVICLHLSGSSEAPGAVRGKRRGPLLFQDFQPAPLPLCHLFYSKTLHSIVLGFRLHYPLSYISPSDLHVCFIRKICA